MKYVAIHPSSKGIQVVFLSKKTRGGPTFQKTTLKRNVNPLDILAIPYTDKGNEIVTGLGPKQVLLRNLDLKLRSKKEVLAALPFQAESLLPYKDEEIVLVPHIEKKTAKGFRVLLQSTTKEQIDQHIREMAKLQIDPDSVSSWASGLFHFAKWTFPTKPNLLHLHLEGDQGIALEITEGKLTTSQTLSVGAAAITTNWEKAKGEVERLFAFFHKAAPHHTEVLLTGELMCGSPLHTFIEARYSLVESAEGTYAVPLGLALDAAAGGCQFRTETNSSNRHKEKRKQSLLAFSAASLGCVLTLTMLGGHMLHRKETALLKQLGYENGKSGSSMEKELSRFVARGSKNRLPLAKNRSATEIITWLATHPSLQGDASISHLSLSRVKPGSLGGEKATSFIKVELDLETTDPAIARGFQRALKSDVDWIDQRKGIEWNADYGIYKTTFHIKGARR